MQPCTVCPRLGTPPHGEGGLGREHRARMSERRRGALNPVVMTGERKGPSVCARAGSAVALKGGSKPTKGSRRARNRWHHAEPTHGGHCAEHRRRHRAASRPEARVRSQRATLRGALASPQEGALPERQIGPAMFVRWQAEGVRNVSEKMAALWDDSELLQQCALAPSRECGSCGETPAHSRPRPRHAAGCLALTLRIKRTRWRRWSRSSRS